MRKTPTWIYKLFELKEFQRRFLAFLPARLGAAGGTSLEIEHKLHKAVTREKARKNMALNRSFESRLASVFSWHTSCFAVTFALGRIDG
jgi:hypothetical protein